ncbi:MAG: deoxyribonuclease II family protein [Acidobacteriota bacterium]
MPRTAPQPLLSSGKPVDWWFVFKLNSAEEPGDPKPSGLNGLFDVAGWKRPDYESNGKKFSQHFLFASQAEPTLQYGQGILGTSLDDPVGATFGQVYDGDFFYVVWNDQFYGDPRDNGDSPWGHSKGMVAWNEAGEGLVLQVSTPSWPASGSRQHPRKTDGNTLGFVSDDDIEVSQHFFSLKLTHDDLLQVLAAMGNASVVTAPDKLQAVRNGGPADVQALVGKLGIKSHSTACTLAPLSSGARLISKPSRLAVPPWQLVSAKLGGVDLRVASWWARPKIYSMEKGSELLTCWDDSLGASGTVEIATTGTWGKISLGLEGGLGRNYNHAKFGVSTSPGDTLSIFGDMNQQGALAPGYSYAKQKCSSSQNGRGGMFYVLDDKALWQSISALLAGASAPTTRPSKD